MKVLTYPSVLNDINASIVRSAFGLYRGHTVISGYTLSPCAKLSEDTLNIARNLARHVCATYEESDNYTFQDFSTLGTDGLCVHQPYRQNDIWIRSSLPVSEKTGVILHEVGHSLMPWHGEPSTKLWIKEFQAELFSHNFLFLMGYDKTELTKRYLWSYAYGGGMKHLRNITADIIQYVLKACDIAGLPV